MSVRMRHTHAHTANRRSHHALKEKQLTICEKCKSPMLRHTACSVCGMYRGRQVIDVASMLKKKEEKRKRREAELKGLNVLKKEKTKKVEAKKEDESGKATAAKPKRMGGMFRRSSTARAGESS